MSLSSHMSQFVAASTSGPVTLSSPQEAYDELCRLYEVETKRLQSAYKAFKGAEDLEDSKGLKVKGFYPYLKISVDHEHLNLDPALSHGAFREIGDYVLNVTDPGIYYGLLEQMKKVSGNSPGIEFEIGLSQEEIPLHYAMRNLNFNLDADLKPKIKTVADENETPEAKQARLETEEVQIKDVQRERVTIARRIFTSRHPERIADYVSSDAPPENTHLILPYNGQRMDHANSQFFYYTRTPMSALQPFVIFSNYNQYVEDVYKYGLAAMFNQEADRSKPHVIAVTRTGHDVKIKEGVEPSDEMKAIKRIVEMRAKKDPQMPACHVMMSDGLGFSMINTGVGAPNANTISDIVSVKRSEAWFMAGHSAGLSPTLDVGDYIFAENYFINPMLPNAQGTGFDYSTIMPLSCPPSSEIQRALKQSVSAYAADQNMDPDAIYRRAALVSTDYRNWERFTKTREGLQETYAATLEMETAFLALKAREQSIPFGAFLKVSDLPHYDKPKTPAMADDFFGEIGPHLGLIIKAIENLKADHMDNMHSRKNRPAEGPKAFIFQ